jgi:nicotinamide mononucleotide transporter
VTWTEAVAVVFGLLAVWLTVRQNILCFPAGLVQVTLYIVVFYRVRLYSDMILHAIYVPLQIYGWYHWRHGGAHHAVLPVTRLSSAGLMVWTGVTLVAAMVWGWGMATLTDAALPYADAVIVMASLTAMWLQARKRLETWVFWIAVNVLGIGVYAAKDLHLTTGLYVVFLVLALLGWIGWRQGISSEASVGGPIAG